MGSSYLKVEELFLFFMIIAKCVENKEKLFSVTFNMINII